MSRMWTGTLLALVMQGGAGEHAYRVAIPKDVATRKVQLVLRNIEVPSDQSAKLQAYIIGEKGDTTYLGSTSIMAIAPKSEGQTEIKVLRIDVTAGLRLWSAAWSRPDSVEVKILPKDGKGRVLSDYKWSAKIVELIPGG